MTAGAHMRRIGDTAVAPIGLGAMLLSIEGRPGESRARETVVAAFDAGATMVDTADAYHLTSDDVGHNEVLVRTALDGVHPRPFIATKGGRVRPGDGRWLTDSSPAHIRSAAQRSRERLGVSTMDLYQLHAPDPTVPFRDSMLALRDVIDEGLAARAGVSNVDEGQLELAAEVLGGRLVSVQNQFSPTNRDARGTVALAEELGIAFLAWRPLGRVAAEPDTPVGRAFADYARTHEVSVPQVVLAWHLASSPVIIPLVGVTRPETARDSFGALCLELPHHELTVLAERG